MDSIKSGKASIRGCFSLLLGFLLYMTTLIAMLKAFGGVSVLLYGFLMGLPVLLVALLVVSEMLNCRDCANPKSVVRSLARTVPLSVSAIVLLHVRIYLNINGVDALKISGILASSATVAVLVIFGYVEVLRDQFPPPGLRRTDTP
jgi:hypothetical protein